jgi:hypothetical protein
MNNDVKEALEALIGLGKCLIRPAVSKTIFIDENKQILKTAHEALSRATINVVNFALQSKEPKSDPETIAMFIKSLMEDPQAKQLFALNANFEDEFVESESSASFKMDGDVAVIEVSLKNPGDFQNIKTAIGNYFLKRIPAITLYLKWVKQS